ncbi:sensor histidine kinase [Vannielia litorea]|uniref:histidine kinase n=1 Tax=Vannielia litorea TaxID=1217970 RepID=A0A1N6EMA0_9RHOB|nr:HAMP domain-containing sensor histidine kinase [Vannielia litorea]SIN84051.1 His Kinase A (phospho-acceptor) domain-containing protein [Vannielia litorea]
MRRFETEDVEFLARQMKDYAEVGKNLVLQRQMIFGAALVLAGYYYSLELAFITGALIAVSEVYDLVIFGKVLAWDGKDRKAARKHLRRICIGTILSAGVIVFYSVAIAVVQGPGTHFMSLFFLFAAALFAAMNNHHILPVLILRLAFYAGAFVFIPVRDIVVTGAGIDSELWAQLFTSVFVLYFVIDCSRIYLSFYRSSVNQMEALKIENHRAQEAYKAKTEFVSTMSHELRTPLTSIKGSIDLAHAGHLGPLSDKAVQVMAIAKRNCTRLIDLIDEILDMQKIEAGRMPFNMTTFDLSSQIEHAVDTNAPYATRLGVRVEFEGPGKPLYVEGDATRIEQVLSNMISNAAKFSPEGSKVRVRVETIADRVRVSVIDQGKGLSDADRERVFDKFSQVDSSDTRKIGGTGLGMNISKQIITAHDGIIDFFGNEERGTTFYFELMLQPDGPAGAAAPEAAAEPEIRRASLAS